MHQKGEMQPYNQHDGYVSPSAPQMPNTGPGPYKGGYVEAAYPQHPPYGGAPQPTGGYVEAAYPQPPPYAGVSQPTGGYVGPTYPHPPYGGAPQTTGGYVGPTYPPPPYGGAPQTTGGDVGRAYPPPQSYGGALQPTGGDVGRAYPPPQSYGGALQPTVIMAPVTSTTVVMNVSFADTPTSCTCPVCRENIVSRVQYNSGLLTWLIFGILLFFGCWVGCCLIPFCVDGCKDVHHFCPRCNHHLFKYKRL